MTPFYADEWVTVYAGDCLDVLRELPDASVDAVVTDPPYGLEFMGREWDGANGFRRSLNAADAGRDSVFGRTSRTSPEYQTASRARAGISALGSIAEGKTPMPSFLGGLNPKCTACGRWQRGSNPCRCETPEFTNERLPRLHAFQEWCEAWAAECLRVLKPGGFILAFGGTRTYHRLTCAIEDAGFEVRDTIAWLYGSGFAKSWNFNSQFGGAWCECESGKALPYSHASHADLRRVQRDVHAPAVARGTGEDPDLFASLQREAARSGVGEARPQGARGLAAAERGSVPGADDGRDESGVGGRLIHRAGQGIPDGAQAGPPEGTAERLRRGAPARDGGDDRSAGDGDRRGPSHQPRPGGQPAGEPAAVPGSHGALDDGAFRGRPVCARCGGLEAAYKGFGTALKPAHEPIVVARKPLAGTVAQNVLAHGTGALNIAGCRIGTTRNVPASHSKTAATIGAVGIGARRTEAELDPNVGRWPTNVVLSHVPLLDDAGNVVGDACADGCVDGCPVAELDRQAPATGAGGPASGPSLREPVGGASRFFPVFRYEAKADSSERPRVDGAAHPTVKPLALMRWLVRLVTPPGGMVLDPFAGSGTTAEACVIEGFRCIAIEREPTYLPLIAARLGKALQPVLDLTP